MKALYTNLIVLLGLFFLVGSFSYSFGQLTDQQEWFPYLSKAKKWSFVSVKNGERLGNLEFDSVTAFAGEEVAKVMNKGKWGVVSVSGKLILPVEYASVEFESYSKTILLEKKGRRCKGLCNFNGIFINPFKYESCKVFYNGIFDSHELPPVYFMKIGDKPVYKCKIKATDENYVIISWNGTVLLDSIQTKYKPNLKVCYYLNDTKIVGTYSAGYQSVNHYPTFIKLNEAEKDHPLYAIGLSDGISIIEENGTELQPGVFFNGIREAPRYKYVSTINDTLSVVILQKGNKWGVIDEMGKELIPFEYSSIDGYGNQLICVSNEGRFVFDSRLIKKTTTPKSGNFYYYDGTLDGYNRTQDPYTGKTGVARTTGEQLIENKWDNIYATDRDSMYFVCTNRYVNSLKGEVEVYDRNGRLVFKRKTDLVHSINKFLISVEVDGEMQLIQLKNGKVLSSSPTPPLSADFVLHSGLSRPDNLGQYKIHDSLLVFPSQNKWTVFDVFGNIVRKSEVTNYDCAEAVFRKNGNYGIHYTSTTKTESLLEIGKTQIHLNSGRVAYNKLIDRIICYSDSISLYSPTGKRLCSIRNQGDRSIYYLNDQRFTKIDSMFIVKIDDRTSFIDYNGAPLFDGLDFDYLSLFQNCIAGYSNGACFLLIDKNKTALKKPYRTIEEFQGVLLCKTDKDADIYTSTGELLFQGCFSVMRYPDCISFIYQNKTYWMNAFGKVYSEKES